MEIMRKMPISNEEKTVAVFQGFSAAGMSLPIKVVELNQWLESIRRADLKLTMGEVIEMLLS